MGRKISLEKTKRFQVVQMLQTMTNKVDDQMPYLPKNKGPSHHTLKKVAEELRIVKKKP